MTKIMSKKLDNIIGARKKENSSYIAYVIATLVYLHDMSLELMYVFLCSVRIKNMFNNSFILMNIEHNVNFETI